MQDAGLVPMDVVAFYPSYSFLTLLVCQEPAYPASYKGVTGGQWSNDEVVRRRETRFSPTQHGFWEPPK